MNRDALLDRAATRPDDWDFIIIGGGATGLGAALEAASRGYRTLLLEQADFAKGTSSRSTKLAHGGVRYLRQGNIALVMDALKERGIMRRNAPHLVHALSFIVPSYDWWSNPFYGTGLKLYDVLAGRQGMGRSRNLSRQETLEHIPTLEPEGLRGGVIYYDGQFDDARLAVNLAQTAVEQGAVLLNYARVDDLLIDDGEVRGVRAVDLETETAHTFRGRVVVNATGVFVDAIRRMEEPDAPALVQPSQGVHVVLDRSFLPGESAIMIPQTDDGRVLFAIPWHNRVLVGTTDTPVDGPALEPQPLVDEIAFLLSHAARYLTKNPRGEDVLSMFAGLRPLVRPEGEANTAEISRDHFLHVSAAGLVTITGGKWTTYRKMGEDTVDHAAALAELDDRPSVTRTLNIHGHLQHPQPLDALSVYGSDAQAIRALMDEDVELAKPLHPDLPIVGAQVVWAARHEMARTVEDVLSRRTRALLLDARASIAMAPRTAVLLGRELGRDDAWVKAQTDAYAELASQYILS